MFEMLLHFDTKPIYFLNNKTLTKGIIEVIPIARFIENDLKVAIIDLETREF